MNEGLKDTDVIHIGYRNKLIDIKKGDQPSRFPAGASMLLRYMLDDCSDVD